MIKAVYILTGGAYNWSIGWHLQHLRTRCAQSSDLRPADGAIFAGCPFRL